jgi:mannose-1-phosphate guanylyltransferase
VKAIVLAAGLGTRLQPYTLLVPKPMLPLGNKPLLEYIIEWIKESKKIDQIILCISYMHRIIEDYFEDGSRFGIKIKYSNTAKPMETAGQLKAAEKLIRRHDGDTSFVCLYSDHIYDFSLDEMINAHINYDAFITMGLLPYKTRLKYGFIDIQEKEIPKCATSKGRITNSSSSKKKISKEERTIKEFHCYNSNRIIAWREKPEISGLINIGCYVMKPGFLEFIPKSVPFRMDHAIRKILLHQKKFVYGFITRSSNFIDIGDKQAYLRMQREYVNKLKDLSSSI